MGLFQTSLNKTGEFPTGTSQGCLRVLFCCEEQHAQTSRLYPEIMTTFLELDPEYVMTCHNICKILLSFIFTEACHFFWDNHQFSRDGTSANLVEPDKSPSGEPHKTPSSNHRLYGINMYKPYPNQSMTLDFPP